MNEQQARQLLERYRQGTATQEEIKLVESWITSELEEGSWDISPEDKDRFKQDLKSRIDRARKQESPGKPTPARITPLWKRIAAAASILLCCSLGLLYYQHQKQKPENNQLTKQDIAPGHNQATLTLANGQKIILTKELRGKLAQQGNTDISVDNKALAYQTQQKTTESTIQYNTLSTAKGEQSPYPLILPDGTKAWLNAASSITFPTAFSGNDRTVTVTGEAYFEVVHNTRKPFRVKVKDQTIEDIGTHFNINGYDDEPSISTTLIEGSVKVSTNTASTILKPGQQANTANNNIKVTQVDPDDAIAWKEGYFQFNTDNLESGMRKIARWYKVDIEYKNAKIKTRPLAGTISKYSNVSQVLKKMELTGAIHLTLSGNKIIVE